MLILSKKKDYYDGVVGTMGIDKTIVYDRKETIFEGKNIPKIFSVKSFRMRYENNIFHAISYRKLTKEIRSKYDSLSYIIVGFCGKVYLGLVLSYKIKTGFLPEDKYVIVYNQDEIKEIVEWSEIDNYLIFVNNYNAIEMFRTYNTPAFVYVDGGRNDKFIVNPILDEYDFYKVFDSFNAFQEIQMFIGGVLGSKENEIIKISDKDKINQHGFDYKWSFRKEKEIKK